MVQNASSTQTVADLTLKRCQPCEGNVPPMHPDQVAAMLQDLPGWESQGNEIAKTYRFQDFHHTMSFVNAVAWVANQENHHPDLEVGYKTCRVRYSTHAVGGLSENDFICAAKVDALMNA
jgi:4a-hydroxytetrahydrobiopterin dehydratase